MKEEPLDSYLPFFISTPSNILLKMTVHHALKKKLSVSFLGLFLKDKHSLCSILQSYTPLKGPDFEKKLKNLNTYPELGESLVMKFSESKHSYQLSNIWEEQKETLYLLHPKVRKQSLKKVLLSLLKLHDFFKTLILREKKQIDPYDFLTEEEKKILIDIMWEKCQASAWKYEPLTNQLYWSKGTFSQYGLNHHSFFPCTDTVVHFHSPEEYTNLNTAFFNCLQKKQPFHFYYHITPKLKHLKPSETCGAPHLVNDIVKSVVGLSWGINNDKKIEEIKEEADYLHATFESTQTYLWHWYIESDQLFITSGLLENLGIQDCHTYKDFLRFIPSDDRKRVAKHLKKHLLDSTPFNVTYRLKNPKTQRHHWIQSKAISFRLKDNKPFRMMGFFNDITATKEKDQEIAESEAVLKALLTITSDPHKSFKNKISQLFKLGNLKLVTQYAAISLIHKKEPKIRTSYAEGFSTADTQLNEAFLRLNHHQLALKEDKLHFYKPSQRRKNAPKIALPFLNTFISFSLNSQEKTYGYLYFASEESRDNPFSDKDLTFIQLLAQWINSEMRKEQDQKKLKYQKEKADSANKTKSLFLANMSHEIRTPLNGILGIIQLLNQTPLNSYQKYLTTNLLKSSSYLKGLLSDILDFEKIENAVEEVHNTPFNLKKAVYEVIQMHYGLASQKKLDFFLYYPLSVPEKVTGDENKLRQILINLISNAIKFTSQGRIILRVNYRENASLPFIFQVYDTGIGIAKKNQKKVFQIFHQLENTSEDEQLIGTGLGLSIIRKTISSLKGKLALESEPGRGSIFTVYLKFTDPKCSQECLNAQLPPIALFTHSPCAKWIFDRLQNPEISFEKQGKVRFFYDLDQLIKSPCKLWVLHLPSSHFSDKIFLDKLCLIIKKHARFCVLLTDLLTLIESHPINEIIHLKIKHLPVTGGDFIQILNQISYQEKRPQSNQKLEDILPSLSSQVPRVLVAEDNPTNLLVISAYLEKLGIEHDHATDGKQATEKATTNAYDLILMDCRMPFLDGYEATRAIRRHEKKLKKTPCIIIALTAFAFKDNQEKCLEVGMDDFISKPIEFSLLKEKIHHFLLSSPSRV